MTPEKPNQSVCGDCKFFDTQSHGEPVGTTPQGEPLGRCRYALDPKVQGAMPGLLLGDLPISAMCKQPVGAFQPRSQSK